MKRMNNHPSWDRYRKLLAGEFGLELSEPNEQLVLLDGHRLRVDEWLPEQTPVGTLILVHGGGGNGRVLAPFAEPALECGWRVLAPDLPGYGLTESAADFDWDYAEWPSLVARLADEATGPVVLMGLSLGGMTAVAAAQQSDSVNAVIATTLVDPSDADTFAGLARWNWLGRLTLFGMSFMPALLDRLQLPLWFATPLGAMSGNAKLQQYFCSDSLLGGSWKPVRFFRTLHRYKLHSNELKCPLWLAHPGSDDWTPTELSLPVWERIVGDKRLVRLTNGAHLPLEQPAYGELSKAIEDCLSSVLVASARADERIDGGGSNCLAHAKRVL